jgi:hypothetical protein
VYPLFPRLGVRVSYGCLWSSSKVAGDYVSMFGIYMYIFYVVPNKKHVNAPN